jgi:hypothetical protein
MRSMQLLTALISCYLLLTSSSSTYVQNPLLLNKW